MWAGIKIIVYMLLAYMLSFYPAYGKSAPERYQTYLVTIHFNQTKIDEIYKCLKGGNEFLISRDFFQHQNIKKEYYQPYIRNFGGADFVDLASLRDVRYAFDPYEMHLKLQFPLEALGEYSMRSRVHLRQPDQGIVINRGAYINYNVTNSNFGGNNVLSALPELTLFSEYGSLRSETLSSISNNKEQNQNIRLMTYYQLDFEDNMEKLVIGDTNSGGNFATGSALYAGVKYTTDFSLDPYFTSYPTIDLKGGHQLPSNISIYANNVKLYQGSVQGGRYQITDLPVISGNGNLEVEVTDLTGNTQKIIIPYYLSPNLLKQGLSTYTVEAGMRREKFGVDSNNYSHALSNLYYRYGVTDWLTVGGYAQTFRNLKGGGGDITYKAGTLGVITTTGGLSKAADKTGSLYSIGYEYLNNAYNFGARYFKYSANFSDISNYPTFYDKGPMIQLFAGYNKDWFGALNCSFTKLQRKESFSFVNLNYRRNLYEKIELSAQLGKESGTRSATTFLVGVNFLLGENKFLAVSRENNGTGPTSNAEYSKYRTTHLDDRYRLKIINGHDVKYAAEYERQFSALKLKAETNNIAGSKLGLLNAQGGIVLSEGLHFTDTLQDTFTLVKVGNVAGVPVKANNNIVGYTDSNGVVVTTNTVPNFQNEIMVHHHHLPMNVHCSDDKKVIYPKRKKAVKVEFDAQEHHAFKGTIVDANTKEPLPVGSILTIEGIAEQLALGYEGMIFISIPHKATTLEGRACYNHECCHISHPITYIENSSVINNLGAIQCTK